MSFPTFATRCLRRPVQANSLSSTSLSRLSPLLSSTLRSFSVSTSSPPSSDASHLLSPAVMFLVRSEGVDPASIKGTGKDGRLLKFDVVQAIKAGTAKKLSPSAKSTSSAGSPTPLPAVKRQEGPRFTATGRRNRSLMFEPLPRPAAAPAASKAPTAAPHTKVQAIDSTSSPATPQSKAAPAKPQPAVQPVLRRQDGPRYTAGGRRNRSAMFHSP